MDERKKWQSWNCLSLPSLFPSIFWLFCGSWKHFLETTLYQRMRSKEDRHGPYPQLFTVPTWQTEKSSRPKKIRKVLKTLCGKVNHKPLSVMLKFKTWKLLIQEQYSVLVLYSGIHRAKIWWDNLIGVLLSGVLYVIPNFHKEVDV